MTHTMSVVVALDDHLLASSLVTALSRSLLVRGPLMSLDALEDELALHPPGVAMVDTTLGGISIMAVLSHWVTRFPATRFVICTQPLELPVAEAARLAGAAAVLDHRIQTEALVKGLRGLCEGKEWSVVADATPATPRHRSAVPLTVQEARVLRQLQEDRKGQLAIANTLGLSLKTVEHHVGAIRRKFGIPKGMRVEWHGYGGK